MSRLTELESFCKLLLVSSLAIWGISAVYKDRLPAPDYYASEDLPDPIQQSTSRQPFMVQAQGHEYRIKPLFEYSLRGVVVTYSNADGFSNIWHHRRWQDYINLRDLCIIWGDNVRSGVYQDISFSSDSWTCWAQWERADVNDRFQLTRLSNNHLLTDSRWVKRALLQAEPGDVVQFNGLLVEYENPANQFKRGSSIRRDDTGNGACETVYLDNFSIVKKANTGWRWLYFWSKWLSILSAVAVLVLMFIAPIKKS